MVINRKERIRVDTYSNSTETFLKACDWLGDADSATVNSLRVMASQLDTKFQTSLASEYNKTVRYLRSLAPVDDTEEDDELLRPQDGA